MNMNTLTHNGYTAEINFSAEDNLFYGKLNVTDLVMFEGNSVEQLKKNFLNAVKDYESALELLGESAEVRKLPKPPMLEFYLLSKNMENPKEKFITGKEIFVEGDMVGGSWVNCDGRTYYQEGKIIRHPKTGLWVESNNGITEIKLFFTLRKL